MSAREDMALIRETALHIIEADKTHTSDCPGCVVDSALARVEAELARLGEEYESQREYADGEYRKALAAEADAARLRDGLRLRDEAILRIYRTPVYEKRGVPCSGISLAMIRAINEARALLGSTEDTA